ncbi:MAG: ABC transporter ATP-binding protein [Clostridia bacterium]|nr:ABC transporter ATP-binding protein [Clostridia bacterium]
MLTFENVSFSYDNAPILSSVSFSLPKRGVIGFSGPSGCGKSTLLRLIAGLEIPSDGVIQRHADTRLAMVFQENRLLPWLTAEENVRLVCEDAEQALQALTAVSLADARDVYPDQLSGGMQRRVALARALAYGGDLLILDEPFTGLDPALCADIAKHILERFRNGLIMLVTHSADEFSLFDVKPYELSGPITGKLC